MSHSSGLSAELVRERINNSKGDCTIEVTESLSTIEPMIILTFHAAPQWAKEVDTLTNPVSYTPSPVTKPMFQFY